MNLIPLYDAVICNNVLVLRKIILKQIYVYGYNIKEDDLICEMLLK